MQLISHRHHYNYYRVLVWINLFADNSSATIYPNPYQDFTTIQLKLSTTENVSIKLLNLLGQQISVIADNKEMISGEYKFDVDNNLPSGNYIVRISVGNETKNLKLIKTK